jgi:hypothetical protein
MDYCRRTPLAGTRFAPRNLVRSHTSSKDILREVSGGVHVLSADRDETIPTPKGHTEGYGRVVGECLERIGRAEPPPMTSDDCARALSLIHDAYRIAAPL